MTTDHFGAEVWFHMTDLAYVMRALACGTAAVEVLLAHSSCRSQTTRTDCCGMTLTHPLAFFSLQLAEEKLQLFHCDAVAGEHTQHVHK